MLSFRKISGLVASVTNLSTSIAPTQNGLKRSRQVWIENFNEPEEKKVGLLELDAEVYGAQPRVDIIYNNVEWQMKYRYVSFAHSKSRAEVRGGGRKPWPQKGLGRARHGSIRSPLFRGGGVAHGPRSPKSHFFMLDFYSRILGLTSTLSVKLAQNDLHIVDDLNIPTADPNFIKDLIKERVWGPSILIVDMDDMFSENISLATESIGYVNLMPAYGLNVYSMLKHDTLIITQNAAKSIESKILHYLNRSDARALGMKFKIDQM